MCIIVYQQLFSEGSYIVYCVSVFHTFLVVVKQKVKERKLIKCDYNIRSSAKRKRTGKFLLCIIF